MEKKLITFLGNGNMALSIAHGLKDNYEIEVVGRDTKKLNIFEEKLGVKIKKSLFNDFDVTQKTVLLCVKPVNVESVGSLLQGEAQLFISVLAGTSLKKLQTHFQAQGFVRSMPNLAASVSRSMTTLCGDENYKVESIEILNAIGSTQWLGSEKEIDIATALAGSGPAYLALMAEALADGAVKQGLKRDDAMNIMKGLFGGFGELIQTTHPALLKDGVMSPGGTTAAGYDALEKNNVRYGCMSAVEAAYKKALEL